MLRNRIDELRSKIKNISCEKTNLDEGVLRAYDALAMEEFKQSFWSELACLIHPEKYFIVNNKVKEALKTLVKRQVIPVKGSSPLTDKELEEFMKATLKFLKEVDPDANYLDVDAFLYFVSETERKRRDLVSQKGKKRKGRESDFVKAIESALGRPVEVTLDEWVDRAIKECLLSDPCAEIGEGMIRAVEGALRVRGQAVLYGVPGTGKTFIAKCVAQKLVGDRGEVEFVTFHPSYSYEEFVEGIRPRIVERDGVKLVEFHIEHGVFKRVSALAICELLRACDILGKHTDLGICDILSRGSGVSRKEIDVDPVFERVAANLETLRREIRERDLDRCMSESSRVLVIDEINRGDIARVFGELITLLEKDKRLFGENEIVVRLPYSKKPFFVPPNLYIIGTMNSADRSIAFVDYALRRRFAFVELEPDKGKVPEKVDGFDMRAFFVKLNEYLEREIDRDHRIGHSYFMGIKTVSDLKAVWFTQIRPLLMEYFYGRDEDVKSRLEELYTRPYIESDEEFRGKLENALKKLGG